MTRRGFLIATVVVILAITVVEHAHSQWRTDGELVEETTWRKSVDNFGVKLQVTDDPEGLFAAWDMPASPDYGPSYTNVKTAKRGDVVLAFVVFSGCAENQDGVCDCSVEYTAYFPDGEVYGQHGGPLWVGYPDPGKGYLQLSEGNLGLRLENDDPFGKYLITADITDNISGTKISLSTDITVVESD